LIDTWIQLRQLESDGERRRALYVLKSRGTGHSSRDREFLLTSEGLQFLGAAEPKPDVRSAGSGRGRTAR
jgi:circadian clock protein KaiC